MGKGETERKEQIMSALKKLWEDITKEWNRGEEAEEPTWEETHPDDVCMSERDHRTY